MNIEELRKKRYQFLNALYEVTKGDEQSRVNMFEIGKELGFDRDLTSRIAKYLDGENLMKFRTIGGGIGITHFGIKEVEKSQTEPTSSSRFFPPVADIQQPVSYNIHVENMNNSQIQQGTQNSTQNMQINSADLNTVKLLTEEITKYIDDIGLEEAPRKELEAQIETLQAQLKTSTPSTGIVSEVLGSVRRIIEGASGNLIATGILTKIGDLLAGSI